MPEVENANTAGAEGAGAAGEAGEQNSSNKGEGAEGDAATGKEGEGDGKPKPKDSEESQGDEDVPVQTRKTAKDFIIERKERKIAKLEAAKAGKGDGEAGDDDDSDEDDVDPEDEKVINKVVSKHLAPIFEKQIEAEDEVEVQQFIATNPDFKPYEAKVKTLMKHPSRREVPIKALFYEAAGDNLLKIGAARAKKAEDDADRSGTGGGSGRGAEGEGKKDWGSMGPVEFEKEKQAILHPAN